MDVHVADLHLAHLILAQEISHTALGLSLREADSSRVVEVPWPAQVSRIVDRMIVARHFAVTTLHVALLYACAARSQNAPSEPGLRFGFVEGGEAAEGGQVFLHHRHLLLLPVTGQFCEVDEVGSFLRTCARFGKLGEKVATEEAVEGEDGDAQAAARDGKQGRKEFLLGADSHISKRRSGSKAG